MLFRHFLKSLHAFNHFSSDDLDAMDKAMFVRQYPDGHVFVQQGMQGQELFMLVEGRVRVSREDDLTGISQDREILRTGELFNLLSLVDNLPATASYTADGSVQVASLPRSAYNLLASAAAPIAHHFQYLVAQQLARELCDRTVSLRRLLAEHK
jgi:CRP/FNR family cyclic AMP-dependent transcriptional regulator